MKNSHPPPKPWIVPNPKAFVLGCDPTAFFLNSNGEKMPLIFNHVFDIDGPDNRYFSGIRNNLLEMDLHYETDVYVQNLVVDYQAEETSRNKNWNHEALKNIAPRKLEFDSVDPSGRIPVFLTSERLYKVLMNDNVPLLSAAELYRQENVIIPAVMNKLGRPLIALYRHPRYQCTNQMPYFKKVRNALT